VVTDLATNQLASSIVATTELNYLSGVTSPIQTQLNNKVSRSGDTMTGTLQLPAGTTVAPSLIFTGSTTTGLSASAGNLSFSTNGIERMEISSGGTISINTFTIPGVVHNDALGLLSSSLIVNADIDPAAAIVDTKLATISTAGKVANSATTATSANTPSTIVLRDASGNFVTNMITLAGTVTNPTDAATKAYVDSVVGGTNLNTPNTVVRRDGTGSFAAQVISIVDEVLTGTLQPSAGTAVAPSIRFTGSTNTGLSAATANTLSFDTNGVERMVISTAAIIDALPASNQAIQAFTVTANNQSVIAAATTSILLLSTVGNRTNLTITFPSTPVNGQYFTILYGSPANSITVINSAPGGATVVNGTTTYSTALGQAGTRYFYYSPTNSWYREATS